VWEKANEVQRQQLVPCIVERVDLVEKERATVTLSLIGFNSPLHENAVSENVIINSKMGPLVGAVTTNPRTVAVSLFIPAGGRSRKKVPKPWQQDVEMINHDQA
jgi:hypothetical protein